MQRLSSLSAQLLPSRDLTKYFDFYSTSEILLRELEPQDYHHGFLQLLAQLTKAPDVPFDDFSRVLASIRASPTLHLVIVALDRSTQTLLAAGTVIVEKKILRGLGKIAHIEDIVVDTKARGKNLGRVIVECLTRIANEEEKVYKVILDCSDKNVGFYRKLNYKPVQNDMGIYQETFAEKYPRIV